MDGTFTNSAALTINTHTGNSGIEMKGGTFDYEGGTLDINDAVSEAILLDGGDFNSSRAIDLTGCDSEYGIRVKNASSTFANTNSILIPAATKSGVVVQDGVFSNTGASATVSITSASTSPSVLLSGGTFNANALGSISVSNSTDSGIKMTGGDLNNDGTINAVGTGTAIEIADASSVLDNTGNGIINTTSATTNGILLNFGTLTNTGNINMSSASNRGLYVKDGTVNFNDGGTVAISNATVDGILQEGGTINNDGDLNFTTATVDAIQLRLAAVAFNNLGDGNITIPDAATFGINLDTATFTNEGAISITSTTVNNSIAIAQSMTIFNNNSSGSLTLSGATLHGFEVNAGTFNNNGSATFAISNAGANGMRLQSGSFVNTSDAASSVTGAGNDGIQINGTGSFSNTGTGAISVSNAGSNGIFVSSTASFSNGSGAAISVSNSTNEGLQFEATGSTNAGTLSLTTKPTPDGDDNLILVVDNGSFSNSGAINLIGDGTGTADQRLLVVEEFGTMNNTGSIVATNLGGEIEQVIRTNGIFSNDVGGSIDVSTSRVLVNNGTFTNNGFVESGYTSGEGVHTNGSGTSINNAFYSFVGGSDDDFSSGGGTITDNGIDVDVAANTSFDLDYLSSDVADIGIGVAYSWYENTDETNYLGANTGAGDFDFDPSVLEDGNIASQTAYTVFGSKVALTFLEVLPVDLLFFEAQNMDSQVELEWATATEINNSGFEIQKSQDGTNWEVLDFVDGAGTTTEKQVYGWSDPRTIPGANYYRLRQIDFDGVSELFEAQFVMVNQSIVGLSLTPNPVSENVRLNVNGKLPEGSISIFDMNGKRWKPILNDNNSMDLRHLPTGIYLMQMMIEGKSMTQKFLKK